MNQLSSSAYTAACTQCDGIDVVQLANPSGEVSVTVVPQVGNIACEFIVNGKNAFWFPYNSIAEFAANSQLCGNPFLAPWANRLDEHAFFANGKKFQLNQGLANYLVDPHDQPIHGLLLYSPHWRVVSLEASADAAEVRSRLEFSQHADLMAQFPFAHRIEMTYRLSGSTLEIHTRINNAGAQPMPLSVGFHPYFRVHDCPRDDWRIRIAARSVWDLNDRFTPKGTPCPVSRVFPGAQSLRLRGQFLDHVFGDLQRDADGLARFRLEGLTERITVAYGPNYPVAVVYAPPGPDQSFVCFEPMTGITNAFNLAHRGVYDELPEIPPGGGWESTYAIEVERF